MASCAAEVPSLSFHTEASAGNLVDERLQVTLTSPDHGAAHALTLDLVHDEGELEPIFSGACWAGTVFWPAAVRLIEHELLPARSELAGQTVLELGCGLGVPGMIAALLGAGEVILTEQAQLVPMLERNVASNEFPQSPPTVAELSWGSDEAHAFLAARAAAGVRNRLDWIVCCDCVFEPLYGESWKLLCDSLLVLAPDAQTRVFISLERRSEDGVEHFLDRLRADFNLTRRWASFEPDELPGLLHRSHVEGEAKPLEIWSATRRAKA